MAEAAVKPAADKGAAASGAAAQAAEVKPVAAVAAEGAKPDAVATAAAAAEAAQWPTDWREQTAGADEKMLKRLQRYSAPRDAFNALAALQMRISAGELRSKLPKDAKPEEVAKWREENGLPESPDKYDLGFADGKPPAGISKEAMDGFLKSAHQANVTPDQAKELVNFWANERKSAIDKVGEEDLRFKEEQVNALEAEWGSEFKANMLRVNSVFDMFPTDVRQLLIGARLADGRPLGSHAGVLKMFAQISREIDPAATLTGAGAGGDVGKVDDRIAQIEKMMSDDRRAYNKDEKVQEEYRNLIDAREKLKAKAA